MTSGKKTMEIDKIVYCFTAKNGKEVILRTPRGEDLDDLVEHINSLVDEGAEILRNTRVTRDQEAEWLEKNLADIKEEKLLFLVAEVDRRIVGTSAVRKRRGYSSHVGDLGVAISKDCRNIGIGTEMLETIISEAKKAGIKTLFLRVFATNKTARHLYEKMGFKETGRTPNIFYKDRKYLDEVTMYKEL
ncbi:MAG: GNAT family N-acetyltransferase [Candidatus Bathyarchaeota archaeon]|nr:MAG: GNAT family N-acetyltransferase [Candidatus Bathyarchaeota archaeon]